MCSDLLLYDELSLGPYNRCLKAWRKGCPITWWYCNFFFDIVMRKTKEVDSSSFWVTVTLKPDWTILIVTLVGDAYEAFYGPNLSVTSRKLLCPCKEVMCRLPMSELLPTPKPCNWAQLGILRHWWRKL